MPTNKPRFTITVDEEIFKLIEDFKYEHRCKNQTQAVLTLIEIGLTDLEHKKKPAGAAESASRALSHEEGILDEAELRLLVLYRNLNIEGREKLLDNADDLVASGKYIKNDPDQLAKEKNA